MSSAEFPLRWKVEAGLAALIIPPLVHVVPLHRLARWLGRPRATPGRHGVPDVRAAAWVDSRLRRLPWPWRRTCLKRAAVLYHLLRRDGVPVELRIGVRRDDTGLLAAHAWLTREDRCYLEPGFQQGEREDRMEDFTEIASFPEPRQRAG
jgi:Transglutaminase-like superfamily